MSKKNKIRWLVFWTAFLALSFFIPIARSVHRKLPPPLPVLGSIKNIQTLDQFGEKFLLISNKKVGVFLDSRDLTSEESVLLQTIQKRLRGVHLKVQMVSFTALEKSLDRYLLSTSLKSNPFIWKFIPLHLEEIFEGENLPKSSLKSIFLVDEKGRLRRKYGLSKYEINLLMIDIGLLINREQFSKPLITTIKESMQG